MRMRRFWFVCAALCLALAIPGCGGGGGGSSGPVILAVNSIQVQTQAQGPESPFGTTQGGDTVLINGTGFVNGLGVRFGPTAAAVQVVTSTRITVLTPAGVAGFATVVVTNPDNESVSTLNVFQYLAPPVIFSIITTTGPTTGEKRAPIAGNETLQIDGSNFKPDATASIGGQALVTAFVSAARVTVTIPSVSSEQAVDVSISNPEGLSSTLNRGLVYTQEFSLERETRSLTQSRARHLFRRAAFGATKAETDAAVSAGLATTVDNLVRYSNNASVEQEAMDAYGARIPPAQGINNSVNKNYWLHLMVKNTNGFQERFAYFLHNHFAIAEVGFNGDFRWTLHPYVNLLRRCTLATSQTLDNGEAGLGFDWRRICIEMGKDQAMLDWLDGRVSRVGAPNENYARELWELFMLGEGRGYTEDDIKEAARAFTGFLWIRTDGRDSPLVMQYRTGRHDAADKTIFGQTGKYGYDNIFPFHQTDPSAQTDTRDTEGGIVALTLGQRPVEASTFICRKLAEFFLYDNIADEMVDELAQDLRAPGQSQWNLRPIIETILLSKAMYSSRAMKGKIKNPIEFVIGFLRTTAIDLSTNRTTNMNRIRTELQSIGQVVLDPPDVNGWPTGVAWLGSQAMLERTNFVNFTITQLTLRTQIDRITPPAGSRSPAELVDHISGLLDVQLSGNARTRLIAYVDEGGSFNEAVLSELTKKVRGLLWAIAPYHDGHQD